MGEGSTDQPDVSASCPGAETLRAFLDERLDEARASRVIAHLAACGRCDDEVAVLAAAGAVTGLERSTADTAIGSFAARLRAQRPPRRPLPKVAPSIPGLRDLEPVGRGGMGVVYRGTETATGETVAVKVLWTVGGLTDSAHARARREVEALGRIDDPGIVRIRHAGVCDGGPLEPDGVPYIVMEWIDGETLQRRLGARALAVNDAAVVIRDLARVLARVHGLGIVHRDIKPANVFLIPAPKTGDTLTPKLVDFGLARPEESAACGTFGELAGTPGYMAPEQWHGDGALGVIGPATDIYGLGATLFFLLVGRPPNDGRPTLAGTSALAASPPEWHAADRPPIPVDLRTIVEKCLRVAPLERYASAGELADDLGRFLGGLPITARKAAISERVVTWVGHNPAKTVAAILTTLFVGMAATGAWLHAVGLSAANQTANVARHRAEDALQRLTGKWIERMIKRGEALDRADREFLREVCDQYRSWPLEPDPVAGLRFRAEGLGKIASILGTLEDRGEAGALYEEAIGVLDVCGSLDGDASALASQRLALLEANYQLFTFVNPGPTISLAAPRIIRLLDDPAARDVRSAADRCVVALARLNLVLATTDWGQAVGADGRTPPLDALDACLRDIDAIAAMYPTEPIVEVTRINGLMASADATWRHFGTAALDRLRLAAVIAQRSAERFPSTDDLNRFSRQHVLTLAKQCDVARGLGDHDASLATARVLKALVAERGKADQSPDLFYRGEGIEAAIREANALVSLGRPQECEGALVEALEHATRSAREQPAVFTHAGRLTKLLLCQSTALQAMHRKAEAARSIRQIADILRPWQASAERSAWTAAIIQNVHVHAGNLLLEAGDPDGAIDDFRKLIRIAPPERRVDAAGYLLNAGRAARRLDVVGEAFGWMMRDEKVRAAVSARLGITGPVNQTDASPESAAGP